MKRLFCISLLAMAMVFGTGTANAQTEEGSGGQMTGQSGHEAHHPGQKGQQQTQQGAMGPGAAGGGMQPGMMMGGGGMGMMGNMMGGKMMGRRGMMGSGMMGSMMCGGMMPGMAIRSPMMGLASGMDQKKIAQYEKFTVETRGLRKKLSDLRFQYGEALWNPDTTLRQLWGMMQEMNLLQKQIQQKMPR